MKFAEKLNAHLTPEWRTQYIDYDELKDHLYRYIQEVEDMQPATEEQIRFHFDLCDEEFFRLCENALKKIETFFSEKLAEATRKFSSLRDELDNYLESLQSKQSNWIAGSKVSLSRRRTESVRRESYDRSRAVSRDRISTTTVSADGSAELRHRFPWKADKALKQTVLVEKKRKKTFRKLHDLKLAFSEFYLSLILLQNYQSLNFTGFRKILKKHDKLMHRNTGLSWRQQVVELATFNTSREVDDLITAVENIYTEKLEQGDRGKAMKRLRVPPLSERHNPQALFRFGFFAGIFLVEVTVIVLTCIFLRPLPAHYLPALRLFRATFLIILFLCLFGVNTYGWRSSGVNNVLIFEIDPRTHLDHFELLEGSFFLAVIWGCAVLFFLYSEVIHSPGYISPFVLILFLLISLFNPFKFGYSRARRWLLGILGRIFRAPFARVSFADFWLADQLTSLSFILPDLAYFFCFYASQVNWKEGMAYVPLPENSTSGIHSTIPNCAYLPDQFLAQSCQCSGLLFGLEPLLKSLPAWFRFAQCLRRYHDMEVKKVNPHLLNAGKYSTTFFVTACLVWVKFDQGIPAFVFLIIFSIIRSGYTYSWDILMDWGLLDAQSENKLLRDELVYRYKAYYYVAIVEDFIFRLTWTIRVSLERCGIGQTVIVDTLLPLFEVIRRFIWNFFRLENEHLNNCGQFRAVRDIFIAPLPKRPPRTSSLTDVNAAGHHTKSGHHNNFNAHHLLKRPNLMLTPRKSAPDFLAEQSCNSDELKKKEIEALENLNICTEDRYPSKNPNYHSHPGRDSVPYVQANVSESLEPPVQPTGGIRKWWVTIKNKMGRKSAANRVDRLETEKYAYKSKHVKPKFTLDDGEAIQLETTQTSSVTITNPSLCREPCQLHSDNEAKVTIHHDHLDINSSPTHLACIRQPRSTTAGPWIEDRRALSGSRKLRFDPQSESHLHDIPSKSISSASSDSPTQARPIINQYPGLDLVIPTSTEANQPMGDQTDDSSDAHYPNTTMGKRLHHSATTTTLLSQASLELEEAQNLVVNPDTDVLINLKPKPAGYLAQSSPIPKRTNSSDRSIISIDRFPQDHSLLP